MIMLTGYHRFTDFNKVVLGGFLFCFASGANAVASSPCALGPTGNTFPGISLDVVGRA
jgi:hypothetical protein